MSAGFDLMSWIQVLGWSLLHFLWQGALIGVLYALTRMLVPREQANLRYAAGLIAMGALAVCVPLTIVVMSADIPAVALATTDAIALPALTLASNVDATQSASLWSELLPWLVLSWMAGVVFMIGRAVRQWRALERVATHLAWRHVELEDLLAGVARRFGPMAAVRILVSGHIDTPTLIGWFKPVILMPLAVVTGFPRQQLGLILAHELGHLRRYDHLVNLAQTVVETLLFYHPVVHWISREVRHEREICCDNLVLRLTRGEPREYARTLAALENVRQVTPQLAVAASGGMLLDRVRRILGAYPAHKSAHRSRRGPWVAGIASLGLVIAIAAGSRISSEESLVVDVLQPALQMRQAEVPLRVEVARQDASLRPEFTRLSVAQVSEPAVLTERVLPDVPAPALASTMEAPEQMVPALPSLDEPLAEVPEAAKEPQDLAVADSIAVPQVKNDGKPAPRAVRIVTPNYPRGSEEAAATKVAFDFTIDRRGKVRDIRAVSGDTEGSFASAARRALKQWRFDPQSVEGFAGTTFRQDFEYSGASDALATVDEEQCASYTGSHICRPIPDGNISRLDRERESSAQMIILAGNYN
ncbi:MAG: TonB family protein [Dokdonella sp.]|nr:MAG: TonB family protein [Gammaproteobacteria bacterium]TXI76534.1 MAG: TonB family protein [Dokdonella sp.]